VHTILVCTFYSIKYGNCSHTFLHLTCTWQRQTCALILTVRYYFLTLTTDRPLLEADHRKCLQDWRRQPHLPLRRFGHIVNKVPILSNLVFSSSSRVYATAKIMLS